MAENDTQDQPIFSIEKLYIKDLSVEVPNAPQIFLERETPNVSIQLRSEGKQVEEGVHDVSLVVTVTATLKGEDDKDEKTLYLVEVNQSGIFQIRNVPQESLEPLLAVACPNILLPYAREAISDAITRAGFQPVLLSPVNFEAVYQQNRQQQAQSNTPAPSQVQ